MEKLTIKQEKVLEEIKKFIAANGYSPSIRELCKIMNISSTSTMFSHVDNLAKKGYIDKSKGKYRTLDLKVPNEYMINNNILTIPFMKNTNIFTSLINPTEYIDLPVQIIQTTYNNLFALLIEEDNKYFNKNDTIIVSKDLNNIDNKLVVILNNGNIDIKEYSETLNKKTILGTIIGHYKKM